MCSEIEELRKLAVKAKDDLDAMTRARNEPGYEIQRLQKTLHKCESNMETQRIDLGAYKTNLGRLQVKYDDFVAQLDEANDEIVMRESGIEATQSAILDLRSQIDHLNRDLAEAESAAAKAEVERDRFQLLFCS